MCCCSCFAALLALTLVFLDFPPLSGHALILLCGLNLNFTKNSLDKERS